MDEQDILICEVLFLIVRQIISCVVSSGLKDDIFYRSIEAQGKAIWITLLSLRLNKQLLNEVLLPRVNEQNDVNISLKNEFNKFIRIQLGGLDLFHWDKHLFPSRSCQSSSHNADCTDCHRISYAVILFLLQAICGDSPVLTNWWGWLLTKALNRFVSSEQKGGGSMKDESMDSSACWQKSAVCRADWTNLLADIRQSDSVKTFKSKRMTHFFPSTLT